jgi:hypothetical protein
MDDEQLSLEIIGSPVPLDHSVRFAAHGLKNPKDWNYKWRVLGPGNVDVSEHRLTNADLDFETTEVQQGSRFVDWIARSVSPGVCTVEVTATRRRGGQARAAATGARGPLVKTESFVLHSKPLSQGDEVRVLREDTRPLEVSLRRSDIVDTLDLPLWSVIRASTNKVSFNNYAAWMDMVFCRRTEWLDELAVFVRHALPFPDIISYKALKVATEAFLVANCGVAMAVGDLSVPDEFKARVEPSLRRERFENLSEEERDERLGLDRGDTAGRLWRRYLVPAELAGDVDENGNGTPGRSIETLPYLALIRQKLPEARIELRADAEEHVELCYEIMGHKLTSPCFLELIWSYWHEEGMLVQTMDAISRRFQNRGRGRRDPLAGFALDPLRPLNNLLWGYVQDEQHRLPLARRVYEYDHEYGIPFYGRSVPRVRSADPRSRFLEAFHTLLHRASIFYKDDDDTTMIADPFPILNALRDVHLLLAEGADNQYGDLPWTARHEMLLEQWLLARPELREFLPTRVMVAYPEPWMDRVDAMKRVQGWSDTSVRYFHDLAVFGEQLLLSIRFGDWSNVFDRNQAGNWARYWRQEAQWYIHAYQAVTGVDLSADTVDVRNGQLPPDRFTQPAFLMHQRLLEQRRRMARLSLGPSTRRGPRRHRGYESEEEFEESSAPH